MLLSEADNLRYKQLQTEPKNNYIMSMYGYPQYLLGLMKLLNNYISESDKIRNFRKTSGEYRTEASFTNIQDKDKNDKKNINRKGGTITFTLGKNITGKQDSEIGRIWICKHQSIEIFLIT